MTFNPDADISKGKASKRGRNTGIAVGGGLGAIALFVISQFLGVDLTPLLGGAEQPAPSTRHSNSARPVRTPTRTSSAACRGRRPHSRRTG